MKEIADISVWVVEAAGAAALIGAIVMLLMRRYRAPLWAPPLLLAVACVGLMSALGNVLEWTGLFPAADVAEDFIAPLIPILWLFLFVVELAHADGERLRRSYDRMLAVHNVASQLTVTMEPQTIMNEVVQSAARLLDAPLAVIFVPDDEQANLIVRAAHGLSPEDARSLRLPRPHTNIWRAFLERKAYRTPHVEEVALPPAVPVFQRHRIASAIDVPLLYGGQAIGVLGAARQRGPAFTDDDLSLLETLAAHTAVAIHNASLYDRVAESEAKYRVLVENARIAIVVVDADRRVAFFNRGAERLYGWKAEEVLGQAIVDFLVPEDKRKAVVGDIIEPLARRGSWFGEYPQIRKDGSTFTGFLSIARVYDESGSHLCTLNIILDVTERAHLREQLLQAQKMETLGTLAGGVAHDFSNLLTGILGFADMLRRTLGPGDENYAAAVQIEQAAARGTELVRQLMAVSHRQPTRTEPVQLNKTVHEAAPLLARTFPGMIRFTMRFHPDLHLIRADPTQMHQVVMNLAINARDAMPDGGELAITTENLDLDPDAARTIGLAPGPHVRLTVSDTGGGIPPEDLSRIFEPFFTTKRKTGGTGLGLSTVYAIVLRHSGHIDCDSRPGEGTTFCITLPALDNSNTPPGESPGAEG